ncbi:MAG: fimbrillin family protein [Muribaculaceae bacterium]|nr:fimbrillin family protein [Muribaculaceae bacterium]
MNKITTSYIILGAFLMLSSCSQENMPGERLDADDRRIVFRASLPELTTRAKEIVTDLPHFYMTADEDFSEGNTLKGYISNKKIEKLGDSSQYKSDECVWPDPGHESNLLRFFAYYPELNDSAKIVDETNVSDNTSGYKIEGFKVTPDISGQVDLVTAFTFGKMADHYFSGIYLTFRHQLSRIEVKAKGSHKSCDIEIAGVRISNVPMQGNFEFQNSVDADGIWSDLVKGNAEYILSEGNAIIKVGAEPVSIIGSIDADNDNCAMLIPTTSPGWDITKDSDNSGKEMYLNVLLRIVDKTPTTGKGKVQYPYFDNSQGLNAMNIPRVCFVVDDNGTVINNLGELYKDANGKYYKDAEKTIVYNVDPGTKIREFGWAALPITANWQPGYSYCYTLDYTYGVGLHGPDVTGEVSPKAGDPIISDRVGVSVSVNDWQGLNGSTTSQIDVPGS